jgi:hypothetical protein
MAAAVAGCAALAEADLVASRAVATNECAVLTLYWPRSVECQSQAKPTELLLRFNRPLEVPGLTRLRAMLSPWLSAAEAGYDTLLLATPRDAVFSVAATGREVRVEIRWAETDPAGDDAEPPDPGERADEARSLYERGHKREAIALMESLCDPAPPDPSALSDLASWHADLGYWRRADELYRRVLREDPEAEGAGIDYAGIRQDYGSQVGCFMSRRTGGVAYTEDQQRVQAQWLSPSYVHIGAEVNRLALEIGEVQYAEGREGSFRGRRWLTDVFVQHTLPHSAWVRADGFAAASGPGLRADGGQPDDTGETGLAAEVQRPCWLFTESVVNDGSRDRIEIRRLQHGDGRWSAEASYGWNRYSVRGARNAVSSLSLEGLASVRALTGPVGISFEYEVDAERLQSIVSRPVPPDPEEEAAADEPDGSEGDDEGDGDDTEYVETIEYYYPLQMESREIHALRLVVSAASRPPWTIEASAGGDWDRETGEGAPAFRGLATYAGSRWTGQIGFERRRDPLKGEDRVSQVTGELRYLF